jgi:hypothetical protein
MGSAGGVCRQRLLFQASASWRMVRLGAPLRRGNLTQVLLIWFDF